MLYRRLTTIIEVEEAVGEMLSNFPATEMERPAPKDHVDKVASDIRADMYKLHNRLIMWMITLDVAMVGLLLGFFRKG